MLLEMLRFKKPNFGAANILSAWIRFTFPGQISEYNTFKPYVYTFIKFKIVIEGLIAVANLLVLWNQDS